MKPFFDPEPVLFTFALVVLIGAFALTIYGSDSRPECQDSQLSKGLGND